MTHIPSSVDVSNTSQITALNQAVTVSVTPSMSNWIVQTNGTWVGTLIFELSADGGVNFVPVNARQSLAGRIANNTSSNGMFRGCVAGGTHFRVRASAWTSGTANATVRLSSGTSPTFMNSIVETRALEQYHASNSGGNTAFNSSTGVVIAPSAGGTIAILNNPANSGVDVYIARIIIGANQDGRFERYRVNGNPTITGSFIAMSNKGGGSNTSGSKMYLPSAATISGGTLSKVVFIGANSAVETIEDGSSILRQSQTLYWWFIPNANQSASTTVTVSFWEQFSPIS